MALRLIDAFPGKLQAKGFANTLRKNKVQFVRVKPVKQGRLRWGVFVGGRNSSMY